MKQTTEFDHRRFYTDIFWVERVIYCIRERKHLFLYGRTGTGKTTVTLQTIHKTYDKSNIVHLPCSDSDFEFSGIKSTTTVIVAGEADRGYLKKHRSNILRLTDGSPFTINPKYERLRTIVFRGLFVIVSNHALLQEEGDEALRRRFQEVQACEKAIQEDCLQTA